MLGLRRNSPVLLLALGVALLVAAWSLAVPVGAAQDEGAHYIKALGTGSGPALGLPPSDLRRRPAPPIPADAPEGVKRGIRSLVWGLKTQRDYRVPTPLAVVDNCPTLPQYIDSGPPLLCPAPTPVRNPGPVTTRVGTHVGLYPPWPYYPDGLVMRTASDPATALRLGRLVGGVLSILLLALGFAAAWRPEAGALSLLAPVAATTPLVLYEAAVLNPSGTELTGAICLSAALFRLLAPPPWPAVTWWAAGAGGVALALSRPLGPSFVLFLVAAVLGVGGRARVARVARERRGPALAAAAVVGLAVVVGLVWLRHQPSQPGSARGLWEELGRSITGLPALLRQAVGLFPADYDVPAAGWLLWAVVVLALLGAGAARATRGERWRLAAVGVVALVAVVVGSDVHLQTGGDPFARYVFPLLLPPVFLAGHLLVEHGDALPLAWRRALGPGVLAVAGLGQLVVWWLAARRTAVGTDGGLFFLSDPAWSPPGGWLLWTLVAVAGAALVALSSLPARRVAGDRAARRSPRRAPPRAG